MNFKITRSCYCSTCCCYKNCVTTLVCKICILNISPTFCMNQRKLKLILDHFYNVALAVPPFFLIHLLVQLNCLYQKFQYNLELTLLLQQSLLVNVIVNAPPLVLQKYPSPFAAVKFAVLIELVCQSTEPCSTKPCLRCT